MKLNNCQNIFKLMKKVTIHSVALFIIVFALADVSILQAYHGNETLGIPPAHHSEQKADCGDKILEIKKDGTTSDTPFFTNHDHNSETDCQGEGECLASCSHVIVSYFGFNANQFKVDSTLQNPLSHEVTSPKSEPADIFHPPQLA